VNIKIFNGALNKYNDIDGLLNQILNNRGLEYPGEYLKKAKNPSSEYSPNMLLNIDIAVKRFLQSIDNNEYIHIIIDSDPDGYTSGAMLYSYTTKDLKYNNIGYSLHTGKQHGISDDIIIPKETKLLIVPDGGSSDYSQHKELKEKGIDIIVLDHHESEKISEDAIVVNNQLCNYPNKNLCGAGIVYKFIKLLDDEMWINESDKYLDLLAVALISDSMDIKDIETRYYINVGLSNIRNKGLKALVDKRSYDIKGHININNIAFYITPLMNAIIRVGKQDEKELLFNALIENDMVFKYKKRGENELVDEIIYDRVARLATNIKAKQGREIDKSIINLVEDIESKHKYNNNILVLNGNNLNKSLTGIMAIKLASRYGKPCLILREEIKNDINQNTKTYGGSGRNIDYSAIENLREYISNTGLAKAEGHASAFGIMDLKATDIPKLIKYFNEDISLKDKVFWVDFIIPFSELSDELIFTIANLKDNWGQGIKEPLIAITDIDVQNEEISVMGKNMDTIKINIDGLSFIKFKCDLNDELINNKKDIVRIDVVGKCSINEWEGSVTPQIIMEEYEIKNTNV